MTTTETPTYWSVDPATFDLWVAELGYAAAGKLMAACAAYFLHGTMPEEIKLTKSARNMFDAERARLDRRRACALNGRKGGRSTASEDVQNPVDNGKSSKKSAKKSRRSSGKVAEKSTENQAPAHAATCENGETRFKVIQNQNPNINPQTPAPSPGGAGSGGRGSGSVTAAEFEAMAATLGFSSPTAYGRAV